MAKKASDSLEYFKKGICAYMAETSFVLTKRDKAELYEQFKEKYSKRSLDEILSGRRYNARVSDFACIRINYRCYEIYELGKQYSKDRTQMKRLAKKGLL